MSEVENISRQLIEQLAVLKTVSNPDSVLPPSEEDIVRKLVESIDDNDLWGV